MQGGKDVVLIKFSEKFLSDSGLVESYFAQT